MGLRFGVTSYVFSLTYNYANLAHFDTSKPLSVLNTSNPKNYLDSLKKYDLGPDRVVHVYPSSGSNIRNYSEEERPINVLLSSTRAIVSMLDQKLKSYFDLQVKLR